MKLTNNKDKFTNHKCKLEDGSIVNYDIARSDLSDITNYEPNKYTDLGFGTFHSVDINGITKPLDGNKGYFFRYKTKDDICNINKISEIHNKLKVFYFIEHEILLIIPKYYTNGTSCLNTLIDNLTNTKEFLSHYINTNNTEIYVNEITTSSRYLHNWSFHCNYKKGLKLPDNTYIIEKDWTLNQWINY